MRDPKWAHPSVLLAIVGALLFNCCLSIEATRGQEGPVSARARFVRSATNGVVGSVVHLRGPVRVVPGFPAPRYGDHSDGRSFVPSSGRHVYARPSWLPPISGRSNEPVRAATLGSASTTTRSPMSSSGTTTTSAAPNRMQLNLTEVCSHVSQNAERQLLAYVSSIESITGTIQELDEVVQQMKPKSCECQVIFGAPTTTTTTTQSPMYAAETLLNSSRVEQPDAPPFTPEIGHGEPAAPAVDNVSSAPDVADLGWKTTTTTLAPTTPGRPGDAGEAVGTTESFFDPSTSSVGTFELNVERAHAGEQLEGRARRAEGEPHYGMPVAHVPSQDPAGEDLLRASEDLKALRRDLSSTAEMLKQTNHNIHSAMLRALLSYVSSIERRIDNQRQVHVQARSSAALRLKIGLIKEKMAVLLERLKSLVPFGHSSSSSNNSSNNNNNNNYGPIVNNVRS